MRTPALLALTLTVLFPVSVRAQPANAQQVATAQALFQQAKAELKKKNYSSACLTLEEVTRLVPDALGAKLTLGSCYEGLGKLASAWEQYTLVEEMAQKVQDSDREQKAFAKTSVLRPRLATLYLQVPPDVAALAGMTVTLDGVTVSQAKWDASLPVDVGAHEIVATAPGREAWEKHVEMKADGTVLSLMVKPLAPEIVATTRVTSTAAPASADQPAPVSSPMLTSRFESTDEPAASDSSTAANALALWRQRPAELTAMGLGSVSVGVGAVLGIIALTKARESDSRQALGTASVTAMIAGGVALAGGVLFLTRSAGQGPGHGGTGKGVQAQLELSPGGLGVRGTW
jgi:hypothetical protein